MRKKKVIQKGVTPVLSVLLTFFSLSQSKIHLLSEYMCPIKKKKAQAYLTVISTDLGSDISITYGHAPSEHSNINEYKSLKSSTWNC